MSGATELSLKLVNLEAHKALNSCDSGGALHWNFNNATCGEILTCCLRSFICSLFFRLSSAAIIAVRQYKIRLKNTLFSEDFYRNTLWCTIPDLTTQKLFTLLPPCLFGCLQHGLLLKFSHQFELSCLSSYFCNMMKYITSITDRIAHKICRYSYTLLIALNNPRRVSIAVRAIKAK